MPTLTIDQALAHALDRHRSGRFDEAEKIYRQILGHQPRHADALHLLGMLQHQTGRPEMAAASIERAIAASPDQAVFHSNLGLVLVAAGKLERAVAAYRRSIELDPHSAQAMNNLGAALHASGQTDEAVTWLERSIDILPDYVDAKNNLGHIWMLRGDSAVAEKNHELALRCFEESVALNPNHAEALHGLGSALHENARSFSALEPLRKSLAITPDSPHTHNNLGNALYQLGQLEESLDCYRRALAINPDFPEASNNLGNVLKSLGRIEEAIAAYSKSVGLQPDRPEPYSNLGNLLREAGQRELAIQSYEAALAIDPEHALTHNNLANAYSETGDWERAIAGYLRALRSFPDYADAMNNLGTAYEEIGRRDEAMVLYRRALMLEPGSISAPWNIALQELLRGEYENGWIGYENRWRQKRQKLAWRNFSEPMLPLIEATQSISLTGKRVLLHAEQGLGDAIQFCRYAPLVADLGATVILECEPVLVRLFATLRGVAEIVPARSLLPVFDFHCPLMSLPMIFSTTVVTVPTAIPYLAANRSDVQRWGERFASEPAALRVGLVWAGAGNHQKDRDRSMKLSDFAAIANIPDITFYSLQLGEPAAQSAAPPPGMRLVDWTRDLHDFAETAAMVSHLDLLITVDTSVGHLAGAMGKPVWTLLAFHPDWRWLLDRENSPWYPQTRLFRQASPRDWSDPLARVSDALNRYRMKPIQARGI
jgi:tetratricopeptide (TPR) repeat protein